MATGNWQMVTSPPRFAELWRENSPGVEPPRAFQHPSGLVAFVGREPVADEDWRWHISVRFGDPGVDGRVPNWDELVMAAHDLRPGVPFVLGIPPRSWWMSVHPHVLHLFETDDQHMISSWFEQRQGERVG